MAIKALNINFKKSRRSCNCYKTMAENFVLEKQMSSFRPSNILIIKYRIFSSSHRKKNTDRLAPKISHHSSTLCVCFLVTWCFVIPLFPPWAILILKSVVQYLQRTLSSTTLLVIHGNSTTYSTLNFAAYCFLFCVFAFPFIILAGRTNNQLSTINTIPTKQINLKNNSYSDYKIIQTTKYTMPRNHFFIDIQNGVVKNMRLKCYTPISFVEK